jgi:hypothetical protein
VDGGAVIAFAVVVVVTTGVCDGPCGLDALVALAEARSEFVFVTDVVTDVVVGGVGVVVGGVSASAAVVGVGGVEDGEEEEALFGWENCCLRRRGSLDMPSERGS